MRNKVLLFDFQKKWIKELGLLVLPTSGGHIAEIGKSIYEYEIIDIYRQYDKKEILNICTKEIHKATLPINSQLGFDMHVLEFNKLGMYLYYYKVGRYYKIK